MQAEDCDPRRPGPRDRPLRDRSTVAGLVSSPRHVDVWFEHRGRLANGAPVNLDRASGGESWTANVPRAWRDYRFKFYLQKLAHPGLEKHVPPYAAWLCREWNADRTGGARLDWIEITAVIEPIALDGEPAEPAELRALFAGGCPR